MCTKKSFVTLGCFTIFVLLLSGCAPPVAPVTPTAVAPSKVGTPVAKPPVAPGALTPTPKPAVEQPRYGGVLTQALGADPPSLDLHQEPAGSAQYLVAPAYNGLIQYDPHNHYSIVPDLAKSWDISADGLSYTFYLNKGVKWHDGKPFTSEDAKFSLDRMRDPPKGTLSPRRATVAVIDKIETPNPETLVLRLKFPSPSLFANLATGFTVVLPKHVVEEKGSMKHVMVGTGPFKFKRYESGVSIELVRNEAYFVQGRPYLDGMIGYIVSDPATRLSALRTKRVLFIPPVYGPSPSEKEILEKADPNIVVQSWSTLTTNELAFNCKRKPWDDRRVRQAVSLLSDRYSALTVIEEGAGDIGGFMEPNGPWALPREELLKMPGYGKDKAADVDRAKRLMAEAGLAGGFKTSILTRKSPKRYVDTAVFMKEELAKLKIEADIRIEETAIFLDKLVRGDFDLYAYSVTTAIDDPDARLSVMYVPDAERNYGKFDNSRMAELNRQQTRELDAAKRKLMVLEMQRILLEEAPLVILYWPGRRMAHWKEVKNYENGPSLQNNNRLEDVWLAR